MLAISRAAVPADSLLRTYRGGPHPERWDNYVDCFCVGVSAQVSLADFVWAFYTSPVFRIERWILRLTIGAPSTDADAKAVAVGTANTFAAWYVGDRTNDQLLMCDRYEATRSWFRVAPLDDGGTLLQFGSGVATRAKANDDGMTISGGFRFLMGFHVLYSRLLLWQASRRVTR
jgi:hypothetical protein